MVGDAPVFKRPDPPRALKRTLVHHALSGEKVGRAIPQVPVVTANAQPCGGPAAVGPMASGTFRGVSPTTGH